MGAGSANQVMQYAAMFSGHREAHRYDIPANFLALETGIRSDRREGRWSSSGLGRCPFDLPHGLSAAAGRAPMGRSLYCGGGVSSRRLDASHAQR